MTSCTSDVTNRANQSSSLNGFIGTNFISIRKARMAIRYVSTVRYASIFAKTFGTSFCNGMGQGWSPRGRSLKSSKIAPSSARRQHYFLNSSNFVGKRQKPRGNFANNFFVFLTWSIGVAKRRGEGGGSASRNFTIGISPLKIEILPKMPIVSSISF